MIFLFYFLILFCSATQVSATKLYNKCSDNSAVFNAIKSASALVLFALMAVIGFRFHLPTVLFGLTGLLQVLEKNIIYQPEIIILLHIKME